MHVGEQIIETTDNHPFWVEGKGWVFADEVQAGDKLQKADGSNLTIDKVEFVKLDEPVTVYNFTVADFHTYYVTDIGIWVHNTKCGNEGTGNRPPNLTPEGAGRNGAFREAKRNSDIPVSQQPEKVAPAVDRRGNRIPGKDYDFGNGKVIRDHSGGHEFPDDPSQNRGPHFNDVDGNHYDYEK